MFIIFNKQTHEILTYGHGYPHVQEKDGKIKIAGQIVCNDSVLYGYRYITDDYGDVAGQDERHFPEMEKPLEQQEIKDQLEAMNAVIMDIIMGGM